MRHEDVVHRADVCALDENNVPRFVIEFQHSFLEIEKIRERETFYPNLVWVVDLTSRKRDSTKLLREVGKLRPFVKGSNVCKAGFADEIFPVNWLHCSCPVFFECSHEGNTEQQPFFCLYPPIQGYACRFIEPVPVSVFMDLSRGIRLAEALKKVSIDLKTLLDNQAMAQKKLEATRTNATFEALLRQPRGWRRGRWHL